MRFAIKKIWIHLAKTGGVFDTTEGEKKTGFVKKVHSTGNEG